MPAYGTLTLPPALYQGDSYLVWNAETIPVTTKSERVALAINLGSSSNAIAVEIVFGGAPGVFEIDVEDADTDVATDYVQRAILNVVTGNNVCRGEITGLVGTFVRLNLVTLTNSVSITAKITSR